MHLLYKLGSATLRAPTPILLHQRRAYNAAARTLALYMLLSAALFLVEYLWGSIDSLQTDVFTTPSLAS